MLAERVLAHPRISRLRGRAGRSACGRRAAAASASSTDRRVRSRRGRRCSRPAARPRSGSGRPTRWARSARASRWPTAPGAAVADLEFMQFHPTALSRLEPPPQRGAARSGRAPARRPRRALHRRARTTRRRRPRDRRARARRCSTSARSSGTASRALMARIEEAGYDPACRADSRSRRRPTTRWAASSPISTGAPSCPGSTPPASAPAPASTARTASRRTRCSSASSSAAGPRSPALERARAFRLEPAQPPTPEPLESVTPELRRALWQDAGLVRDAAGLERLRRAPHLLTRLIAESALTRDGEPRRALPRRLPDARIRRSPAMSSSDPGRSPCSSDGRSPGARSRAHRARRARRGRRRRRPDDRGHRRRGRDVYRADCCSRSRASSAACPRSKPSSASLDPNVSVRRRSRADGDRCRAAHRARAHRRPHARGPHRRAHGAQPPRPPVRNRDADAPLRRRDRGHRRGDPRHAQDDAGAAGAREVRRALRRRAQPPLRPRRRDPRQGQPPARRGRGRAGGRAASRGRNGLPIEVEAETLDDVREALAAGAEQILLDNMPPALMREAVAARRRAGRRSRPRAASRSRPSARSPRPASTSSRSAR